MKQFCFTPRTVALNIHTMLVTEQWLYSGYIECLPLDIYDNLDLNASYMFAVMQYKLNRFTYMDTPNDLPCCFIISMM